MTTNSLPVDQTNLKKFAQAVIRFAIEHPAPVDQPLHMVIEVGATLRFVQPEDADTVLAEQADQLFRTTQGLDAFLASAKEMVAA